MSELPHVLVDREADLLRVTLNRPEAHNALTRDMLDTLHEVFSGHRDNAALCGVVLRGAGEAFFAAGIDPEELAGLKRREDAARLAEEGRRALNAIRAFPVPVLAMLNGDAVGGGAELALACDFRVAAAHAGLAWRQEGLDVATAWGGAVDLMRLLEPSRALALLCLDQRVAGGQAQALGLLDAVAVPGQTLDACVEDFLAPLRRRAPATLRAFKALAHAQRRGVPRERMEDLEARQFAAGWPEDDRRPAPHPAQPRGKP